MNKLVLLHPFLAVPVPATASDRLRVLTRRPVPIPQLLSFIQFRERGHTEPRAASAVKATFCTVDLIQCPLEVSRKISLGLRVRCLSQGDVLSDGIWVTFKHGISVNVWPWWALLRVAASAASCFGSCGWTFLEPGGAVLWRRERDCPGHGSVRNTACERNWVITTWKIHQPAFKKGEGRLRARRS